MDSLSKKFGFRIKQIRESLSLTQEEFAYRCGMQASHIGQLERGEKNPTLDTLYKISSGMNITLPDLLDFSLQVAVSSFDETTNKIIACVQPLPKAKKEQILSIIKIFIEDL